MAIIISADYIGGIVASIRQRNEIPASQLAHLFGCGAKQLHRYEEGKDLVPRDVLKRIIKYAAKMDAALSQ